MSSIHYYHRNDDLIEIIIRDSTGAKLERWCCRLSDRDALKKLIQNLKEKYGFELDEDNDWIDGDNSFL